MRAPLERHVLPVVLEYLRTFRIVLVNGPRQAGKTTLARRVRELRGGTYVTLDDPATLALASSDPAGFITDVEEPLLVDEFQRAGEPLVRQLKMSVDTDSRRGRFLLTGSARFLTVPGITESLAGRVGIVDLWPMSQGELIGRRERFVERLLEGISNPRAVKAEELDRPGLFKRVSTGGFPEVATGAAPVGPAWFDAYLATVGALEVADISRARVVADLPALLRLLAARTAQVLNTAGVARDAGVAESNLRSWLPLMETVYLIRRLPAWSRNLTSKVARRPKLHLVDSGLAASLLRVGPAALSRPGARAAGQLLETFVVSDITKQLSWSDEAVDLYHFRDRDGTEVDLVLEARDGRVSAVEVKAGLSFRDSDLRGLRLLRDKLGPLFVQGVLLYAGSQKYPLGDRLCALPISAIWAA